MSNNHKGKKINLLYGDAKQMMEVFQSKTHESTEVESFIELEKKKFKKTDNLEDIIYRN